MMLKIKKRHFYFAVISIILLFIILFASSKLRNGSMYIDKSGFLAVDAKKQQDYRILSYEENENYTIKKIIYTDFGKEIYGFLVLPQQNREVPGIVLLPGSGVDKKSELPFAIKLAEAGYAVLTIDQRGIGETNGETPSFEEGFNAYLNGNYAVQHLMVADALAAKDVLREQDFVKQDKIVMVGESLGGRIALIAAAIDKDIKGVIAISAAGFHYPQGKDKKSVFIASIDADNYIKKISPKKLFMLHNFYDKNVPIESALETFKKAKEPKQFIAVNDTGCNHGFCDSMLDGILSSLASITG